METELDRMTGPVRGPRGNGGMGLEEGTMSRRREQTERGVGIEPAGALRVRLVIRPCSR